jgi:hypothetical protein
MEEQLNWRQMERKFDEWDMVLVKCEGKKHLVLGDSIMWDVGTKHSHLRVSRN